MTERRNTFEFFRDHAADLFEAHMGSAWRPRAGSKVNHRALTAAMIDSRDYLAAKRRAEIEPLMPAGPKVAFAGGFECNDYTAHLGRPRQGARETSRHGSAPWRLAEGGGIHRGALGRRPQSSTGGLQAGLDPARQGGAVQAQRSAPSVDADRGQWCSRAQASPRTSLTRRRRWVSRSRASVGAHERRYSLVSSKWRSNGLSIGDLVSLR